MKSYVLLPFVLLAGLIMGGMGPRSELEKMREELEEAKKLARSGGGTAAISDVTNLLGIQRRSSAPASQKPDAVSEAGGADTGAESISEDEASQRVEAEIAAKQQAEVSASDEAAENQPERGFEEDIDRAIELWQTRVAIARNTFVANTRLSDAEAAQFDTIVDAMNVRIGTKIDEFAKEVAGAETVQPEAGIRLVNDITESMVSAYDDLDRSMPQEWRRGAGGKFTMTDFIDPEVARPLVGVQGKMEQMIH